MKRPAKKPRKVTEIGRVHQAAEPKTGWVSVGQSGCGRKRAIPAGWC